MDGEKKPLVLITGGTGLIGKHLTSLLLSEGYRVSVLSRHSGNQGDEVLIHKWSPEKKFLDPSVFKGVDYVIHLAGENLGKKRWTTARKKRLLESRVSTAKLLYNVIESNNINIKAFITASGSNYYGTLTSEKIFSENDQPGEDFLAALCQKWEDAADLFRQSGFRTVILRQGIVLQKDNPALKRLIFPSRFGFLVRVGNGKQYMPWIHINDLVNIYLKAINDNSMTGPYNASSPRNITYNEFIETMGIVLKRSVILPLPAFLIRLIFGKMADLILNGSRVSAKKIQDTGFRFFYSDLRYALENLFT